MDVFVARQPIFDRRGRIYGYELLFRSGLDNFFDHSDPDQASSAVISNSFFTIGIETITRGRRAFINLTRNLLIRDSVALLPKKVTVVEILENTTFDDEVLAACRRLKRSGYRIALDDFVYSDRYKPVFDLVDILKVDFRVPQQAEREAELQKRRRQPVKLLAEKVETPEEFHHAVDLGYSYFQGYFFSKPEIVIGKDVPAFKLNYLRILQQIHRPGMDLEQLETIFKHEVSLSYKLLRYINSAAFGFRSTISSIRHALLLLGERNFKKWASLIILTAMARDKPEELVVASLVRARLGELLAPKIGFENRTPELFLMGMFSMIDAILGRPLADILAELPMTEEVKAALLGDTNRFSLPYQLIVAYERGNWGKVAEYATQLRLDETELPDSHFKAVQWANRISWTSS